MRTIDQLKSEIDALGLVLHFHEGAEPTVRLMMGSETVAVEPWPVLVLTVEGEEVGRHKLHSPGPRCYAAMCALLNVTPEEAAAWRFDDAGQVEAIQAMVDSLSASTRLDEARLAREVKMICEHPGYNGIARLP